MDRKNSTAIVLDQFNHYNGIVTFQQFSLRRKSKQKNGFSMKRIIIVSVFIGVFLTLLIGALTLVTKHTIQNLRSNLKTNVTSEKRNVSDSGSNGKILNIISRDAWLAQPSSSPLDDLSLPVHRVIIADTGTESCFDMPKCTFYIQNIQSFHMLEMSFRDIAFNFLVGGNGGVYEGRGWNSTGAHTKGYIEDTISIAFIGNFSTVTPPEKQLNAAKLIIEEGVRQNYLHKNYKIFGARQLKPSDSPGNALYEIIKKWPNWSSNIN